MATWDDVHRLARALPQTAEGSSRDGLLAWSVKYKRFSSERPLRRGDLQALGDAAPQGSAARVPDLGTKEALLADDGGVYFTTPHFDGYPAILVRLDWIAAPSSRPGWPAPRSAWPLSTSTAVALRGPRKVACR